MMPQKSDTYPLRIAIIRRNDRGHATNKTLEWKALIERLGKPYVDRDLTFEKYSKLSVTQKGIAKDVGAFVGGPFKDGVRQAHNIEERSVITLDVDAASAIEIDLLKIGLSDLSDYEFFASTTRSHSPESPRWRLVFPTTRMVKAEEYAPLARILASRLFHTVESSMDATDDVSFRVAQIMYWPSINSDGVFDAFRNRGRFVDPDTIFEEFGPGWRDWTQLPYSEKRGQKRPTVGTKAEDPREKRGIVGAFCRTYDVPAAIKKFLPTVYVPGDMRGRKPRYTYAAGSGANGAVVEDGGLFLYSHHGTDPCGERLVNAFDMVRLHLFGTEDVGTPEDTRAIDVPSFQSFQEFLEKDPETVSEFRKAQYDIEAMFDDVPEESTTDRAPSEGKKDDSFDLFGDGEADSETEERDASWLSELEVSDKGEIKPTLTNIATIIQNDPRLNGSVEFNDFTQETVTRKPIRSSMAIIPKFKTRDGVNGDIWTDRHDFSVRALLEAPKGKGKPGYGLRVTDRDLKGAVELAAGKHVFHPVRDYLNGLVWDGVPRIEMLFVDFLGAPNSAYTRGIARTMMLGGVTRVFEPGHKFDFVVILEGAQGRKKSTFISTLAKNWFVELEGELRDRKQIVEKMQGAWILEIPELSGFGKAEIQTIKEFFSAKHDKVRLSYDRRGKLFLRQCIFLGSTNDAEYLRDNTGGRRFWPVQCADTPIDIPRFKAQVDQMWAEAVYKYREMRAVQPDDILPLYLSDDEAAGEALKMQESRRVEGAEDAMAGVISAWLDKPIIRDDDDGVDDMEGSGPIYWQRDHTCLIEIWSHCLGRPKDQYSEGQARTLGRAIKLVKEWESIGPRKTAEFGTQRVYRRKGSDGGPFSPVASARDAERVGDELF